MKKIVLAVAILVGATTFSQENKATDVVALKAKQAEKEAEIAKLQGEVDGIKNQIFSMPGWKFGGMGIIGANFSGYNNWFTNAAPNSESGVIKIGVTGFANLDRAKYFWRNTGNLNLGWTQLDTNLKDDIKNDYEATTDLLNINSLFGYKLTETLAASAMAEFRTSVIKNFVKPGYLDFGVGATWTPIKELVVVAHPLNYNYVIYRGGESNYDSSLGCKFMAEYNKDFGYLKYRSNLSAFLSYGDMENLSNWTWVNSLGFNLWKGIGVGLEAGLRQNKQEAFNSYPANYFEGNLLENSHNPLQSYWLVGLSYGF